LFNFFWLRPPRCLSQEGRGRHQKWGQGRYPKNWERTVVSPEMIENQKFSEWACLWWKILADFRRAFLAYSEFQEPPAQFW